MNYVLTTELKGVEVFLLGSENLEVKASVDWTVNIEMSKNQIDISTGINQIEIHATDLDTDKEVKIDAREFEVTNELKVTEHSQIFIDQILIDLQDKKITVA